MKLTNKHNIPEPIYQYVLERLYPPKEGRLGITDLINPPLIRTLRLKYWDNIEQDVSEFLWMVLSGGIHHILSKYDDKLLLEHKMEYQIGDITVVGKADIIDGDAIDDYKVTSIWSYLLGAKDEWEQQLNCYAYLRTKEGMNETDVPPVRHLRIHNMLRDWMKSKSVQKDYPPIPFMTKYVKLWTFEEQEQFINNRVKDHLENPERECTDKEKWCKPNTYAVMKKGNKKALRVLDSECEAIQWCVEKGYCQTVNAPIVLPNNIDIIERRGNKVRCSNNYCGVKSVCPYCV